MNIFDALRLVPNWQLLLFMVATIAIGDVTRALLKWVYGKDNQK